MLMLESYRVQRHTSFPEQVSFRLGLEPGTLQKLLCLSSCMYATFLLVVKLKEVKLPAASVSLVKDVASCCW